MKALTFWEPWASLVRWDVKSIETRSWSTRYRGTVAVHAAKRDDLGGLGLRSPEFKAMERALCEAGMRCRCGHAAAEHGSFGCGFADGACPCYVLRFDWPLGMVIATAELVDVVPTEQVQFIPDGGIGGGVPWGLGDGCAVAIESQRPWGDFRPGRFAWLLGDVEPLEPVPARGRQQLWEWTP